MIKPWLVANESLSDAPQFAVLKEDPTESLEARLLEVKSESNATEQLLDQISDMSGDLATLETLERSITEAPEVTSATAAVLDVAIESFCHRWNVEVQKPGSESQICLWGGSQKQIALEGIGDVVAKGFKRFIEFVKELARKFANLFKSSTNLVHTAEQRVKQLRKLAASSKDVGNAPKVALPNAFLNIDGKTNPLGVVLFIKNIQRQLPEMLTKLEKAAEAIRHDSEKDPDIALNYGLPAKSNLTHKVLALYNAKAGFALPNDRVLFTYEYRVQQIGDVRVESLTEMIKGATNDDIEVILSAVELAISLSKDADRFYQAFQHTLNQLSEMRADVLKNEDPHTFTKLARRMANINITLSAILNSITHSISGLLHYVKESLATRKLAS